MARASAILEDVSSAGAQAWLLLSLLPACTFQPDAVPAGGDGPPGPNGDAAAGAHGRGGAEAVGVGPGPPGFGPPEVVVELATAGSEDDVTLRADLLEVFFDRDGDIFAA